MIPVEIRPVRPEEYEEAGRVTADAYREFSTGSEDWEGYLVRLADVAGRAGHTIVLVALRDGRIAGTVTLELDRRVEEDEDRREAEQLPEHESHIRMLGVDPGARGRGIGRALMEESMRIARDRGKSLMTLHTTSRMEAAQRMYEGMGFERQPDVEVGEDFSLLSYTISLEP